MHKKTSSKKGKSLKIKWGLDDWIASGLIILGFFIPAINLIEILLPWFQALFSDIRGEIIGIGIGVLLINNAAEHMAYWAEEKQKDILKVGSSDNSLAKEGIKNLQDHGWFDDGSMSGYRYPNANWRGVDLSGAKISGSDLQSADMGYAVLNNVDLSGSSLRNAYLGGTIISNTNLEGADLSLVNLDDTKFFNITYDENTKWPINFDPNENLKEGEFELEIHNDDDDYGVHIDFK